MDSATNAQNNEGCDWDIDSATTAHNDVLVSVNSYVTVDVCSVTRMSVMVRERLRQRDGSE